MLIVVIPLVFLTPRGSGAVPVPYSAAESILSAKHFGEDPRQLSVNTLSVLQQFAGDGDDSGEGFGGERNLLQCRIRRCDRRILGVPSARRVTREPGQVDL